MLWPLSYPGQVRVHDKINLLVFLFLTSGWTKYVVTVSHFYVTTHSPTLPSLYPRHSSFSNPSVASPTSQFILQPFFRLSYVTSSSFNSPGEPPMPVTWQWWTVYTELILQPFRHFTYVTTHPNPSVALPTSQLILQPFRCFNYVTVHSPTFLSLILRHKLFI